MTTNAGFTCDSCRKRFRGQALRSMTGRELCQNGSDTLTGLAAGMIASDASPGSAQEVGQAIATAGWFSRIRKAWRARS